MFVTIFERWLKTEMSDNKNIISTLPLPNKRENTDRAK
jgi:hypothetical protein